MADVVVMKNSRHMSASIAHFLNITASLEIGNSKDSLITVPINDRVDEVRRGPHFFGD